jgi:hypothetical protein
VQVKRGKVGSACFNGAGGAKTENEGSAECRVGDLQLFSGDRRKYQKLEETTMISGSEGSEGIDLQRGFSGGGGGGPRVFFKITPRHCNR